MAVAPYGWTVIDVQNRVMLSRAWDPSFFSAETLVDVLESELKSVNKSLGEIQYIALVSGPGNYTGLRLSATTVNFLAQILGVQLIPITTFEWIGAHVADFSGTYLGVTPSVKGQINTQLLSVNEGQVEVQSELIGMTAAEFKLFVAKFNVPFKIVGVLPNDFVGLLAEFPLLQFVALTLDSRFAITVAKRHLDLARSFISPVYFHQAVRPAS